MQRSSRVLCAAVVLLASLRPAAGAIFLLHGGGRVEGDLVNADESPRTSYVIALPNGGQVTLDAAVVEKVQPVKPELAEYEKVRRQYPDTVQGQLQLADWCREHKLADQKNTHLERVLQLDPDQPEARRLLGYRKVKDQWMTHDEEMADRGYVKRTVRGTTKWLSPVEAELEESREKQHAAETEWISKISTWRIWLDGRQAKQGEENLRAIKDPMAVFGLSQRLKKDKNYQARLMYIEALGNINHPAARQPLAICAMDDDVEEVRLTCLEVLQKQSDPAVTKYFIARMRDKNATDALVNRAGVALGRIKDPAAIETLIEYLETTHEEVIQNPAGPGAMSAAFNKKGPGSSLGMGQKPTTITRTVQNQDVLDALVRITGQNFGFDWRAWLTWYRNQKAAGAPVEAKKS
jgi:hypothetical protein